MTDGMIVSGVFLFWALAVGGWIANLVKFASSLGDPITGIELLRGIGIIAVPVGCVLGFF